MSKKIYSLISIILVLLISTSLYSCNKTQEEYTLSNANANSTTQTIFNYLCSQVGSHVLAGQQESLWIDGSEYEMNYIYNNTNKLPSIRGFDYMNDDFDGVNARAKQWWVDGGLVTICWHTGCDFSGEYSDCKNDNIEDWDAALTDGTIENQILIQGMDKAAKALSELQEEGMVVLWRPFHEFDGGWFWWGKSTPDNFVKLWQIMYDRYTNYWQLNNLIWVLGFSHNADQDNIESWYPGDNYCDIVGADSYDGGAQNKLYKSVLKIPTTTKPCCFHECGTNPTSNQLKRVPWIWFMTWHSTYLTESNTVENLYDLYNSEYVITRDELPNFD